MLSNSKIEEVSQNYFVLDVVQFKNEEVSHNCCVSDVVNFENEKVSQNSMVFKLADRQVDRQTER